MFSQTVHRLESVPIQSADGNICTSLDVGTSLDVMLDGCVQMCTLITNFIPNVLVTLGKHGVLWTTKNKPRSDVSATITAIVRSVKQSRSGSHLRETCFVLFVMSAYLIQLPLRRLADSNVTYLVALGVFCCRGHAPVTSLLCITPPTGSDIQI